MGGVGGQLHGATRPTRHVDVLVCRTRTNLERVAAALNELRARLRAEGLTDAEAQALTPSWDASRIERLEILTLQTDAGPLDILADIPDQSGRRLRYEDLRPDATTVPIAPDLVAHLASTRAIIASKEWANRPKDRDALPELRQLAEPRDAKPRPPTK